MVELRRVIAAKGCHSLNHLKLVFCGQTLPDESTGGMEDSVVRFEDGGKFWDLIFLIKLFCLID